MRPLGIDDAAELQALFDRCADFFELTEGGILSAEEELRLRAPGKSAEDTFCLGVFRDDVLAGFIHMTRDYPKPNEWWLGLLLLAPSARGAGLGAEVHDALIAKARAEGARVMWLGVLTQNERAHRFWLRRGYFERERQQYVSAHGMESTIVLMSQEV